MIEIAPHKKRIEFIDLAKGVCILLVVLGHCNIYVPFPGFGMLRMPLYFILSGLFFKDYGGIFEFLLRKINKILIPFIFFYIIAYIPFYIFKITNPGLIVSDAQGLLDVFNNRQFFNGPIWFLLSLFWTNVIFCIISLNIKNEFIRAITVVFIGLFGIGLGKFDIFIPCFIDVAMTSLPYFYIGYILKKTPILYSNKYDQYNIIFILLGYSVSYIISTFYEKTYMSFHYNHMYGNILLNYIGSFSCVISVLLLCKMIKYLPIISYCGRYSIILLCVHHMIYRPIKIGIEHFAYNAEFTSIATAVLTVILCIGMIPICVKFLPMVTAQTDLLKKEHIMNFKRLLCLN